MKSILSICIWALFSIQGVAQYPSIAEKTNKMVFDDGYFKTYYDESSNEIWLEIDKLNTEFLYVNSLTSGVGSNDIGLDRGQLGDTRVVYFERRGPRVLLVQPNYRYRAETDNALERKSVREAFASSIIAGFEIEAEEKGKLLVNLTDFLLKDAHGVSSRLKYLNQGTFTLDKTRSALYREGILNFPENTEFEAILTFEGKDPGSWIRSVVPTPEALTVRQHHSFIQLPDQNYTPRKMDPRAGYFGISYQDYGTSIEEDLKKRFIARHRLEKKDPNAELSEPVEPIVYYLDNGTPEPVRSALLDGARWWNEAFEAAGYKNAFSVKVLPEDAHPLDVRYNVIQWIHRSTRGWSYGSSVTDPRTGEIIKGHVSLGSLRVRQDYLIAVGLLAPFSEEGQSDQMKEMALARIRQLSAHEIGHTLGIAHNFAASTIGDASVMDYPHPKPELINGQVDLSAPYDVGIGEWDKAVIRYGYQDFPEGTNEEQALDDILKEAYDSGLKYISDKDARPQGGAHPEAHLWDFGSDPSTQLSKILEIRNIALKKFGENNLKSGQPMAQLEDVLVPIYFFHRYQLEGTVKLIGGLDYSYNLKGDALPSPKIVEQGKQEKALNEMLKALEPEVLAIPEKLLEIIPPRPPALGGSRELFRGNTGPVLDALGIAETAAEIPVRLILNAERANRLVEFSARDENLSLEKVLDALISASWARKVRKGYMGSIQRVVNHVVLREMMDLALDEIANPLTRSIVYKKLSLLQAQLMNRDEADSRYAVFQIERFFNEPEDFKRPAAPSAPPGSPIGSGVWLTCDY